MAICKQCGKDMLTTDSCTKIPIIVNGISFDPIPYGEETRAEFSVNSERCHDCNVEIGGFHHGRCDVEECPVCHRQLISCDCIFEHIGQQRILKIEKDPDN